MIDTKWLHESVWYSQMQTVMLSWGEFSVFYNSFILRAASTTPLLGALIIGLDFGEGDCFGFAVLDNLHSNLLSLYFGGWLILLSYAIYIFFCPSLIKRYPNKEFDCYKISEQMTLRDTVTIVFNVAQNTQLFQTPSRRRDRFCRDVRRLLEELLEAKGCDQERMRYQIDIFVGQLGSFGVPDIRTFEKLKNTTIASSVRPKDDTYTNELKNDLISVWQKELNESMPITRMFLYILAYLGCLLLFAPMLLTLAEILGRYPPL